MKYDSGFTPAPQDSTSSYSSQTRQDIVDGLRDRLATEEARIEERRDNFYNKLLPLCDTTTDVSAATRRKHYALSNQSRDVFTQYQQYQTKLEKLQFQQRQRRDAAMSQYSGVGMRAQRDKAGAEASAEFDKQIAQTQGFVSQSFAQYSAQNLQVDVANQEKVNARFDQISAFNDAISEGFSLASDTMDLGKLQQQIGFFEGLA